MNKRDKRHIAFFVPSLNIGGVESVFLTYSDMLASRGYEVDLVVCKPEGILIGKVPNGVKLVHFGGIKLRKVIPYLRHYLKNSGVGTLVCGPDITNFIAVLANLSLQSKNRINLIVTQHSVLDCDAKDIGLLGRMIPLGKRLLYRFASSVLAVSNAVAIDLAQSGVPKHKITTIYNPISVEKIEQLSMELCQVDLPADYVVFVGRLNGVKNVGLLIKAFELLDDKELCLVIVGDGAMRGEWELMAREGAKYDRIVFTGPLSNPAPVLRGARVVAVPSLSEAFPMVVIEASALGKTIVHTPNIGCIEILGTRYGYCSEGFDNPSDFAHTLQRALNAPIESEKMKRIAFALDESEIIPKLEKLIDR